jgi:pimeloyl-ACP methyl ester carboxylesterase
MSFAAANGANLYFEETGAGEPIVFVHEFGGDFRAWEAQVRYFSRYYRCITYNARGYPPSDIPEQDSAYGQVPATDDIAAVMQHLGIGAAHIVGLSMGASAALHFGLRYRSMARSLVLASVGSGSRQSDRPTYKTEMEEIARRMLHDDTLQTALALAHGATRIQLKNKDPRGWQEFLLHLSQRPARGLAATLRNYQALRPSLYDFEDKLSSMDVPTLLIVGDEDDPVLETNIYLKRTISTSGLLVMPRTGHAVNLEEPAQFNQAVNEFFASVERGRWQRRDPLARSGQPVFNFNAAAER